MVGSGVEGEPAGGSDGIGVGRVPVPAGHRAAQARAAPRYGPGCAVAGGS